MIFTRRFGEPGALPTLLAHCFLGHSGAWRAMVEAFGIRLDALAFDMPGHGQSTVPVPPQDLHAAVSQIITGLVTQPSLLIGHSFGGASVLRHALHHPATARGLVLIEPVFFAAARGTPEYDAYIAEQRVMDAALAAGDLAQAVRLFLAQNPGSPDFDSLPGPAQDLLMAQIRLHDAGNAGILGDSGQLLAPGLMQGFAPPVLIVLGADTAPLFRATAEGLARRLPNAQIAVIEGAGHMVPISHPQPTAARIEAWCHESGLLETGQAPERVP